ncbi:ATP-binding protein [Staphylococcus roterodami]|nr:ATP-binding protein [Staphylococcus roterodami]
MKFHHRLMLLISTILIISFVTLGIIIHASTTYVLSEKHEQALATDARSYIYLLQDNEINKLKKIVKQQNVDLLITKNDKNVFKSGQLKATKTEESYIQNKNIFTFNEKINDYHVWIKGYNNDISEMHWTLWKYLILTCLIVLICLYFASRSFKRTLIRPIQEVTYATELLANGYYHIRVPESNVVETKALFVSTNDLARRLQKLNNEQKIQSNRLKTTIENIPSAILMIDRNGKIVVANKAYYEQFNISHNIEQISYHGYVNIEIEQLILESFKIEKPIYEQLEVSINTVHTKYFDISCVPILTRSQKSLQGILVVMHDITNLKQLENLRREFVANVSHELKTPITSIKGFAETLIDGAKNDSESLDMFLNIILKESNRIESLVTDLLDLSHIEQHTELDTEYMNLSDLTKRIINNMMTQANQKNIKIHTEIQADVIVKAQESKIAQVITNLLTNAINYSFENGEIDVRVYRDDFNVVFEVQDFGIGIKLEDQQRIFERFYRVDKARSRDSGGTGLGLSITKHIVEAHQGNIEVSSQVGRGSTFKVILKDYKA